MRKSRSLSSSPSSQETISGFCYLAFQLIFLPSLLTWVNGQLTHPLNSAELNFVYYLINFMAMLLIFHDFLGRSLHQVGQHPAYFCQAVILGAVAYHRLPRFPAALCGTHVQIPDGKRDRMRLEMLRKRSRRSCGTCVPCEHPPAGCRAVQ